MEYDAKMRMLGSTNFGFTKEKHALLQEAVEKARMLEPEAKKDKATLQEMEDSLFYKIEAHLVTNMPEKISLKDKIELVKQRVLRVVLEETENPYQRRELECFVQRQSKAKKCCSQYIDPWFCQLWIDYAGMCRLRKDVYEKMLDQGICSFSAASIIAIANFFESEGDPQNDHELTRPVKDLRMAVKLLTSSLEEFKSLLD